MENKNKAVEAAEESFEIFVAELWDTLFEKVDTQDIRKIQKRAMELSAEVWNAGRESVGIDMLNPLVNGMREASENPFERN